MTGYRLTPRAHDGFHRIVLYVEDRFGSDVCDRVVDDLQSAFQRLAEHPDIGHRREDLTNEEQILF